MHLWHHEYGSFLRLAQLDFCRRLIVVPLTTFHRLAEVIGVPQGELIFLYNTARCGSTLFSRVSDNAMIIAIVTEIQGTTTVSEHCPK